MTVSFNEIPSRLRLPLFYAEFDNSRANQGGASQAYEPLFIANKLPAGTQNPLEVVQVSSTEQAKSLFGAGSVLAEMLERYFDNNNAQIVSAVALDDLAAGSEATGSIAFSGTATRAGIVSALIGGRNAQAGVATGDTAADIAAAFVSAVNAIADMPVVAAVDGSVSSQVNFTAKHKGEFTNEIKLVLSYFSGEALPEGITATITAMSGGLGNPDVDTVWPVIDQDKQYILLCSPYVDQQNLIKIEQELAERFNALRAVDGYHITSKSDTFGALTTLGESRNSQFNTIMGANGPMPAYAFAGALVGRINLSGSIDPARPFQTLVLSGILPPLPADKFSFVERNNLLFSGISTFSVNGGGQVQVEGVVTTFKENAFGSPDESYTYLNSPLTLSFLRFDLAARITSKFPRHKLGDDGSDFEPGIAVVTPSVVKAEIINKFKEWERKALVEGFTQFKDELIVERNADNPNRLDVLMSPDLVNQLRVVATKIQFLL